AEVRRVLTSTGVVLAIEDIPTASKANVLGHLLHRADGGSFIRATANYTRLYQAHSRLERDWTFRSGICDYSACVLRPEGLFAPPLYNEPLQRRCRARV